MSHVTDGVDGAIHQLASCTASHKKQFRSRQGPYPLPPMGLIQYSNRIGLLHVRTQLRQCLIEGDTDADSQAQFFLNGLADGFSDLNAGAINRLAAVTSSQHSSMPYGSIRSV